MNSLPESSYFAGPFEDPLSAEDIERLDQGINEIITRFFSEGPGRDTALAMNLPQKLEGYIMLLEHLEKDRASHYGPDHSHVLRAIFERVKAYYNTST